MATKDETNEEQSLQRAHIRQRRAVNNALGSLLGSHNNQAFQAFTFEDAVDLQIERIEGKGTPLRPSRLDHVDRIEKELIQAVAALKTVPPERFVEASPDEDVNTEE